MFKSSSSSNLSVASRLEPPPVDADRNSREASFAIDLQTGRVIEANAGLESIIGHAAEHLIGTRLDVLQPGCPTPHTKPLTETVWRTPGLHEDICIARAGESYAIVSLRVSHDLTDARQRAICIVRDETERRRLEFELIDQHVALLRSLEETELQKRRVEALSTRLREATRRAALSEVVAEVAHCINNPLGALSSSLRVLQQKLDRNETVSTSEQQILERCEQLTKRISRSVDELRAACHHALPAGTSEHCNVEQEVRSAMDVLAHRKPPGVHISVCLDPNLFARIPADELHHCATNLIANAFDAVGHEGTIHIDAWRDENLAKLRVRDSGPGIDESLRDRIFEPFFSTKRSPGDNSPKQSTGKPPIGGMGVGLSVARRTALRHQGSLVLECTPKGASFLLKVPATNEEIGIEVAP